MGAGGDTTYRIRVDASGVPKGTREAEKAFAAVTKEVDTLVQRLTGQGATHQLNLLEQAVNKAGGTSNVSKNQIAALRKEVQSLADQGGRVPASLAAMNQRLEQTDGLAAKAGASIKNILGGVAMSAVLAAGAAFTGAVVGTGAALAESVQQAVSYESAFAGVRKTVDASEEEFKALSLEIRQMSKELPLSANELAKVTEAAGQLGIKNENLVSFTETMAKLGITTNLSSDEAATSLARFNNIVSQGKDEFDRLGSTIVGLGNNFATTEREIVAMGLRLAGAGEQVGLSRAEILAFATTLSSVGIEAEAGGTAMSKVMIDMAAAVSKGGGDLEAFARVAGQSSADFKKAFQQDAAGALVAFIGGLGKLKAEGGNVLGVLESMGITEVRMRDALLRTSSASDQLTSAMQLANAEWEKNNALNAEAEQRIRTTESQWILLENAVRDVAIEAGGALLPAVQLVIEGLGEELLPILEDVAGLLVDNKDEITAFTREGLEVLSETLRGSAEMFRLVKAEVEILSTGFGVLIDNPVTRWVQDQVNEFGILKTVIREVGDAIEERLLGPLATLRQLGRDSKARDAAKAGLEPPLGIPSPLALPDYLGVGTMGPTPLLPGATVPMAGKSGGKLPDFPLAPSKKELQEAERRQKKYLRDLEKFEKDVLKEIKKAEEELLKEDLEAEIAARQEAALEIKRMTFAGNEGVAVGSGGLFADPQVLREMAEAEERIHQIELASEAAAAAEAHAAAQALAWMNAFDSFGSLFGTIAGGLERIGVSADSAGVKVLGLAEAGANLGAAIASGDIVQMIGSGFELAGRIKDVFDKPEFERIAADVGRRFGTQISEALAKAIEQTENELGVGRHMAELLSLGDIMGESDRDAREFSDQIGDLLNAIALNAVPAEEGIAELEEAFGQVAEAALKAGSVGDQALRGIIQRAKELDLSIPAIDKFIGDSLTGAAAGVGGGIKNIDIVDEDDAKAQATILASTFWAMYEEVGIIQAGDAFRETFAHLQDQLNELGFEAPPGLAEISGILDLTEQNAEFRRAVEGAEAYRQALEGVANADMLSREAFDSFAQQAQASIDQAIAGGATTEQAYQGVAPLLRSLAEAARNYGYELTEAEAAMLANAEAAGVAFPVDPIERAASAMQDVADVLREIFGLAKDVGGALGGIAGGGGKPGHFEGIPPQHAAQGFYHPSLPPGPLPGGATPFLLHQGEGAMIVPGGFGSGNTGITGGGLGGLVVNLSIVAPTGDATAIANKLDEELRDGGRLKRRIQEIAQSAQG